VPAAPVRVEIPLTYQQALASPCLSCPTSPCCNLLKLDTIDFGTYADVDYAVYLLNFDGILLQMDISGRRAHVYLEQSCRFFDRSNGFCGVHRTPEQPAICIHYNEYKCSYRDHMMLDLDQDVPLVDRNRMGWYVAAVQYDDSGVICRLPGGEEMLRAFASIPLDRERVEPPAQPERLVARLHDSCEGCPAYCCKTLVFDRGVPSDASKVDEFKYCLGFPSVELGVMDDGWALLVRTTCRHLELDRCSVFGTGQRPSRCSQIEAQGCQYRMNLGTPGPEGFLRVSREQFSLLAGSIIFDELGDVVAVPPVELLRQMFEQRT
jgi:hypothetical protein